jgi:hypothetical protein
MRSPTGGEMARPLLPMGSGSMLESGSHFNAKYGSDPGVTFYTHISDQYAPFHTRVINAPVHDATYVLDGLLNHESDLRVEEHYTDTAGFTDHVFSLMHLLGFRFALRIRDLKDKNLYVHGDAKAYPTLSGLVGGPIQVKHIRTHWDEILRLGSFDKAGRSHCLADAAQAGQLSSPERSGGGVTSTGADRTHAVHTGLAAKHGIAATGPDRAE